MAIFNIHETLLAYTKQKTEINNQLSTVMMNMLSASRQAASTQEKYNDKESELYMEYYNEGEIDIYEIESERLNQEHELELANLNEINTFENTWTKLLQNNIKNDFSYGAVQQ